MDQRKLQRSRLRTGGGPPPPDNPTVDPEVFEDRGEVAKKFGVMNFPSFFPPPLKKAFPIPIPVAPAAAARSAAQL